MRSSNRVTPVSMIATSHPAEAFEPEVSAAQSRATLAKVALSLTVLVRAYNIPVRLWQSGLLHAIEAGNPADQSVLESSDALVSFGAFAELGVLLLTGVLFLRWLHKLVLATRALGGDTLSFSAREAVTGFVIPLINFMRPYQIVRDVHDTLAPDRVPEPPVQVRADEMRGYRDVSITPPPAPAKLPHASIGAWWGFFWVGNLLANFASRQHPDTVSGLLFANTFNNVGDVVDIVSASLAVLVVRSVTARLTERYRRVRHNSPEALQAAGVAIG